METSTERIRYHLRRETLLESHPPTNT